jgi:hypothetical protein
VCGFSTEVQQLLLEDADCPAIAETQGNLLFINFYLFFIYFFSNGRTGSAGGAAAGLAGKGGDADLESNSGMDQGAKAKADRVEKVAEGALAAAVTAMIV